MYGGGANSNGCSRTDDRCAGSGQTGGTGAGGGADAAPIRAAGRNVYPALATGKRAGAVPNGDPYFLGRAELAKGVQLEPLINGTGKHKFLSSIGSFFGAEFLPRGFLQMIYLDQDGFDKQHYKFTYVGREFLGEVRCLTFDVDPLKNAGKGRFAGRIWVEDQDYHIVRFNGSSLGSFGPERDLRGFILFGKLHRMRA